MVVGARRGMLQWERGENRKARVKNTSELCFFERVIFVINGIIEIDLEFDEIIYPCTRGGLNKSGETPTFYISNALSVFILFCRNY